MAKALGSHVFFPPMTVSNFYADGGLDRAAHLREEPNWLEAALARPGTLLVPVWQSRNLITQLGETPAAVRLAAAQAAPLLAPPPPLPLLPPPPHPTPLPP